MLALLLCCLCDDQIFKQLFEILIAYIDTAYFVTCPIDYLYCVLIEWYPFFVFGICHLALLIQFSRYNAAQRRRKFLLISITFPLSCAVAVSTPPAPPVEYGQPAVAYCPVRFPASPVPLCLSSCLFRWPLLLLPAFHFPLTGL